MKANSENLNDYQLRLVDLYLREAKASGVALSPETRRDFLKLAHHLKKLQDSYRLVVYTRYKMQDSKDFILVSQNDHRIQ